MFVFPVEPNVRSIPEASIGINSFLRSQPRAASRNMLKMQEPKRSSSDAMFILVLRKAISNYQPLGTVEPSGSATSLGH